MNQELYDEIPELEDFTETLSKLSIQNKKESNQYIGDYTEPKLEKPQTITLNQKKEDSFGGFKKGFLDQKPKEKEKKQQSQQQEQIVLNPQKKNPLEIDEVQQNMKQHQPNLARYVADNKDKWLNEDLLSKVSQNPKLQKLFSNKEYLQAFQQMQTNPKEVMQRYSQNNEFMALFNEFTKLMAEHFTNLQGSQEKKQEQQPQISEVNLQKKEKGQKVVKIPFIQFSQQSQEEKIQEIIQNDVEVREILKDQKVINFIQYLQKTGKLDFNQVVQNDSELGNKIKLLITKGILNVQGA